MNKELINAQDLADALGLSVETIWRYTREKKIPYLELGKKQYRYRLQEVIQALAGISVREQSPGYVPDPEKSYAYQDYLDLPEEPGYRYEVLDGALSMDPSPSRLHQGVLLELAFHLKGYFRQYDPQGKLYVAPLDVTLGAKTVVQPDILYVRKDQSEILLPDRINGAPYLVIEIISSSTERKDRTSKLNLYLKAGVQHYWLVKPEDRYFECYSLVNGLYCLNISAGDEDILEHPDFPGLRLELAALWINQ